ncbi:hypothetical protein ACYOEI_10365 [Singulisphaera rosea]
MIFAVKLGAYLPAVLLLVAVIVAVVMAYRMWDEMREDYSPATDLEVLSEIEQAHAAGEMDEAEFRRVREILARSNPARSGASQLIKRPPASAEDDPSTED